MGVYGIHKYPAMLHFKLVSALIDEFSEEGDVVYDPFCGSGTTLNVAIRKGRHAIGTDINPVALLIARVRSYYGLDPRGALRDLIRVWDSLEPDVPEVKNLTYWFKKDTIRDLGKLRRFLLSLPASREREMLLVAFSQTVRDVSLTRKGEFKRYRMPQRSVENFNPDVLKVFVNTVKDYTLRLRTFGRPRASMRLYLHDVRYSLPFSEKVDLVITSPPYGDSRTTVAYGDFFSFSLEWMRGLIDVPEVNIDRRSLGGVVANETDNLQALPSFPTLRGTLFSIAKKDKKRAMEVASFYHDLFKSVFNIGSQVSEGGTVCFVVGNRTVKGTIVPMDEIVKEMFEYLGFKHMETRVRRITNKRMPSKNSPSNVRGKVGNTMHEEYIVIFRKP